MFGTSIKEKEKDKFLETKFVFYKKKKSLNSGLILCYYSSPRQ